MDKSSVSGRRPRPAGAADGSRVRTMTGWLPESLRRRLHNRATLTRAVDNSAWLFGEQLVRMVAGFAVGVWMARQLGPAQYGLLNYVTAVVGIVGAFASLGLNTVVVRELAREPEEAGSLLGSAFFLKMLGATAGWLACVIVAWGGGAESGLRILLPVCGLGLFFQAWDVLDLWFQAQGHARVSAQLRIVVSLVMTLLRVGLILLHAPLVAFVIGGVLELALCAAGWGWMARRYGVGKSGWRREKARILGLLRDSWPLALGGLAIQAQAQGDQVILAALLGEAELGHYAVALRVVGVVAFLPVVLHTVAAPEITRAWRDDAFLYRRRLHDFYRLMMGLFVLVAVPLALFGPAAVRWVFGESYAAAGALVPLLAGRLFFANFGVARNAFLTAEGLFRFGLVTSVAGAVTSLALNFWLVPRLGVTGTILASFGAFGVTTFALDAFHPKARANLRLMAAAMLRPWRSLD